MTKHLKFNIYFFVDCILSLQADHLLTTDIVSIIHKMGYKAIAEGVETEVQKVYLERVGCDWIWVTWLVNL